MGARAAVLAAITLATGALAFALLLLPRQPRELRSRRLLSLPWTVGAWACAALAAIAPARLFLQARGLVDPGEAVWPMAANVLGTTWGRGWGVQAAGALVALAGFLLARRGRNGGWQLALAGTLAVALSAPFMGHAVATARASPLAVGLDALHIMAAGMWVGTLFVLALVTAARGADAAAGDSIAALITSFHPIALRCAALVLASGAGGLLLRVAHLGSLFGSSYGNAFLLKVGAASTVAAFGAWHSRTAERRARSGGMEGLARSLATEAAFAALTILATAVLTGTEPPDAM